MDEVVLENGDQVPGLVVDQIIDVHKLLEVFILVFVFIAEDLG